MLRIALSVATVLLGMTGCAPCSDIDRRMAAVPMTAPDPSVDQFVVQGSGLGITAHVNQLFVPGKAALDTRRTLSWETLAIRLSSSGSQAQVGVTIATPTEVVGGTLSFPVRLVTLRADGGFRVGVAPDGPSTLSLAGGASDPGALARLEPLRSGWLEGTPLLSFSGWFRPGERLPVVVRDAVFEGGVVRVQGSTALVASGVATNERALRPGMADDFTLAVSHSLLSALARGGWTPAVSASGSPSPPSDGWTVLPMPPEPGPRGLLVPVLARADDACRFVELSAPGRPLVQDGAFAWKAPGVPTVLDERQATGVEPETLAQAALSSLALPIAHPPLAGARGEAVVRIVRTSDTAVLLDGVLGPVTVRMKEAPAQVPGLRGPPASP